MTKFCIEHNVPLPSPRREYPFAEMKVGDSFYVSVERGEVPYIVLKKICSASFNHSMRHGGKFTARQKKNGARCWKIGD